MKREWLQTKRPKKALHFRKLYIPYSKNRQNVPGTILFREPNNIVCRVKQYSFTSQTRLFHARKSNLWKMEVINPEFHSPEGVPCQQIGRFQKGWYTGHWVSAMKGWRTSIAQKDSIPPPSAIMCILRIAWEGPRNPPNCILVRGCALWRPSFDKMSKAPGVGMVRQCKGRATGQATLPSGKKLAFSQGQAAVCSRNIAIFAYLNYEKCLSDWKWVIATNL